MWEERDKLIGRRTILKKEPSFDDFENPPDGIAKKPIFYNTLQFFTIHLSNTQMLRVFKKPFRCPQILSVTPEASKNLKYIVPQPSEQKQEVKKGLSKKHMRAFIYRCEPQGSPWETHKVFFFLVGQFIYIFKLKLIYNAVLISAVQQSDSVIHIYSFLYSFPLWFIIGYYCIWFPVLYSRTLLFIHSIYTTLHLLIPNSQSIPTPPLLPLGNHKSVFYSVTVSVS